MPSPELPPPGELTFAPVGIVHLTRDNTDLLRAAARGKQRLRVTTATQLNGTPHIGTVVTVLPVFAITAHAAKTLNLPATVIFDALDNAQPSRSRSTTRPTHATSATSSTPASSTVPTRSPGLNGSWRGQLIIHRSPERTATKKVVAAIRYALVNGWPSAKL